MPEGDTIYRAAQTLHRALAGRVVTEFDSMFPALTRVNVDTPVVGRTIESVTARGKHSLMAFSGDLVLRTGVRLADRRAQRVEGGGDSVEVPAEILEEVAERFGGAERRDERIERQPELLDEDV